MAVVKVRPNVDLHEADTFFDRNEEFVTSDERGRYLASLELVDIISLDAPNEDGSWPLRVLSCASCAEEHTVTALPLNDADRAETGATHVFGCGEVPVYVSASGAAYCDPPTYDPANDPTPEPEPQAEETQEETTVESTTDLDIAPAPPPSDERAPRRGRRRPNDKALPGPTELN